MANSRLDPLNWNVPIVEPSTGKPTPEFLRKWKAQQSINGSINIQVLLDSISAVQGTVLYRGPTSWTGLAPGTDSFVLTTHGAGQNPTWATKEFRAVCSAPGVPTSSQNFFTILMKANDALPANLVGSLIGCVTAPTADWTVTLSKNGSPLTTGTILAGQTVGSWDTGGAATFANGDVLSLDAPASADVTIDTPTFTILGTRRL